MKKVFIVTVDAIKEDKTESRVYSYSRSTTIYPKSEVIFDGIIGILQAKEFSISTISVVEKDEDMEADNE